MAISLMYYKLQIILPTLANSCLAVQHAVRSRYFAARLGFGARLYLVILPGLTNSRKVCYVFFGFSCGRGYSYRRTQPFRFVSSHYNALAEGTNCRG